MIHLPTRGKEPDVDLFEIMNSIYSTIDQIPEEKRPKHIHFSIGINGNDAEQTKHSYDKAMRMLKGLKKQNDDLPFSVKVSGFQWSVSGPEGAKDFIPFGAIRNHLFDETFAKNQDDSLNNGCRYIQMDGDMTFNHHALRECLELGDDEYTAMPSQASASDPRYTTTQEAFELNAKIQRAVGDDAYFSEKMQLFGPQAMRDLIDRRRQGTEIHGKSDCEGFFIDTHLQNSGCHFKAMPSSDESVDLHNFEKKYYVKNKSIKTRKQFINWLSSLAGQRENMSGSDFFAHQLARKYVTNDIPIIKAQKSLYLPNLMRNGHSLKNAEGIVHALEMNTTAGLSDKQKTVYHQFLSDVEKISHPQRQQIKQRVLSQVREILNFAKEKADGLSNEDLKHHLQNTSVFLTDDDENINQEVNSQPLVDEYRRFNVMPRMRFPVNQKQKELKKNFIAVPSLEAPGELSALHVFNQLYSKVTQAIQADDGLKQRYSDCTPTMLPSKVMARTPNKRRKTGQAAPTIMISGKPVQLPDEFRQPPAGFEQELEDQQIKTRLSTRKAINKYLKGLGCKSGSQLQKM